MLLNYSIVNSPSDTEDVYDQIRSFAVAQGWTQHEFLAGYAYNRASPYGWETAKNADFAQLTSDGYNSGQNLIAALERRGEFIEVMMRSQTAYNVTGADGPCQQNNLMRRYYYYPQGNTDFDTEESTYALYRPGWSLDAAAMTKLWLFGDDKWICAVVSVDGNFVTAFHFGSWEPTWEWPTGTTLACCGKSLVRKYVTNAYQSVWDNYLTADSIANAFSCNYINTGTSSYGYSYSLGLYYDTRDIFDGDSLNLTNRNARLLEPTDPLVGNDIWSRSPSPYSWFWKKANAFSGKRPMMKQVIFGEDQGGTYHPLAISPFYLFQFEGLGVGDTISYGSEDYLVFPFYYPAYRYQDQPGGGFAFRIA